MKLALALLCLLPAGVAASTTDPLAAASITLFTANADPLPAETTLTLFGDDGPTTTALDDTPEADTGRGSLTLAAGYRHESLRFNIAADRSGKRTPNILSELEWRVPMAELRLNADWTHRSGFTVEGRFAWAHGLSGGKVQDSDYLLDNRAGEFSRSYADPDHSTAYDLSLGAGWRFPLGQRARLSALAGYALKHVHFSMRNGRQVLSLPPQSMPLGDFAGLDSSYTPQWRGPWLALKGELALGAGFAVHAGLGYHRLKLKAEADWNLRGDRAHPVSFRHSGSGDGWDVELGGRWRFSRGQELSLDLGKHRFDLEGGVHTNYFADGSASRLRLNEVRSENWSAVVGYRISY